MNCLFVSACLLARLSTRLVVCAVVVGLFAAVAGANSISVASWNVGNLPNSAADSAELELVLSHMGQVAGAHLDLLGLVETDTASAASTLSSLQSVYAGSTYQSVISNPDGGGDRTGLFFNTATLSLLGSTELAGGSLTHRIVRAQFQPVGQSAQAGFYVYSIHLKSGDGIADRATRAAEAAQLRADADALGIANILFVGDFNWQGAQERGTAGVSAFEVFDAPGNARALDPVDAIGSWRDNPEYLSLHTNAPGAAMDDRFDMHLLTEELFDGAGLDYLQGSYAVIGNDGTHTLNGPITTGTGAPTDVLAALAGFSDHLPVLTRYAVVPEPSFIGLLAITAMTRRRRAVA